MSNIRDKFDLHTSHQWESLVPLNNEFLHKKELGLTNFYENSMKNKFNVSDLQINTMNSNKTPELKRRKSYFSPKMSLLRSAALKKTLLRGSELDKTKPKENLFIMHSIEEEGNFEGKPGGFKGKESFSSRIQLNLKGIFEYEKLNDYRNSLEVQSLCEEETKFLEFVKKNEVKNVEKMVRFNRNLTKIRDRVSFFSDFKGNKGVFSIF